MGQSGADDLFLSVGFFPGWIAMIQGRLKIISLADETEKLKATLQRERPFPFAYSEQE